MIRQNLHTHSILDDGKDTIEEMVQAAADKGFTILGFSGHGWNPIDPGSMSPESTEQYKIQVRQAARAAAEQGLQIYCGIEEDSLCPVDPEEWDYVIGSVHYLKTRGQAWPVDYSPGQFEQMLEQGFDSDLHRLYEAYWSAVADQADNERMQIAGHIDLIAKYNEGERYFSFSDPVYLAHAEKAICRLAEAGKIFEMNTGAMSRGWRTEPYPHPLLLEMIHRYGGKLILSTDCHSREALDLGLNRCLELARQAGFTHLMMLTDQGFLPRPLEEFEGEASPDSNATCS